MLQDCCLVDCEFSCFVVKDQGWREGRMSNLLMQESAVGLRTEEHLDDFQLVRVADLLYLPQLAALDNLHDLVGHLAAHTGNRGGLAVASDGRRVAFYGRYSLPAEFRQRYQGKSVQMLSALVHTMGTYLQMSLMDSSF